MDAQGSCSLFAISLYSKREPTADAEKQVEAMTTDMDKIQIQGEDKREADLELTSEKYGKLFDNTTIAEVLEKGAAMAQSATEEKESLVQSLVVAGWVKTGRTQGGGTFAFIELNDGSTPKNLQVIITQEIGCKYVESFGSLTSTGSSLAVRGNLKKTPQGTKQPIELHATEVLFHGPCDGAKYPIAKKKTSFEFLRSQLHLRARTNTISALARIRNALAMATHLFFQNNGFFYVHTPIITTSDAEGAGECFQVTTLLGASDVAVQQPHLSDEEFEALCGECAMKGEEVKAAKAASKEDPKDEARKDLVKHLVGELVDLKEKIEKAKHRRENPDGFRRTKEGQIDYHHDFFGKEAFLAVSGQLQGESYACAMSKIYTFGPTFRAENSHTTRHAAEFWMIEPEIAFADLADVMNCAEDYVRFCCKYLLENCEDDMNFMTRMIDKGAMARVKSVVDSKFARCSYTEAISVLEEENKKRKGKKKFENALYWGCDLASEHERFLAEQHFKRPTIVYDYPKDIKAFYMKLNDDGKTVAAMDVLAPGVGELVGGSQREENYQVLMDKIEVGGLEAKDYEAYLDLRKYGTVPHGGFGLGFDRLIMFTTGIENIRETSPYPRWPGHANS